MKSIPIIAGLGMLALSVAVPAGAQTMTPVAPQPAPATPSNSNRFGALGNLFGNRLPNVGSVGASNAAGVLGYCVKNNVLGGASATSVLGTLAGKAGVANSPAYAAGEDGMLQTGRSALSLDGLKGQVRTQVCAMVLKRAKAFL